MYRYRAVQNIDQLYQSTYDRVAARYDELWSPHVQPPNDRLTHGMRLRPGERLVDLACGSGVATLPMMRLLAPGETVAVDPSLGMLRLAIDRAARERLHLTPVQSKAEDFIAAAPPSSFDAVSMRFALAYLDWRRVLPEIGRLMRPRGRVAILTSLATSAPQAMATYRELAADLGSHADAEPPTPYTREIVEQLLQRGGLEIAESWQHNFRSWFGGGADAIRWLIDTGYVTHPEIAALDPELKDMLIEQFGAHLEQRYRQAEGVPLDFVLAGVIARL